MTVEIRTELSVDQCAAKLRQICRSMSADTAPIPHKDAFGTEDHADLEVLASGSKFLGGKWAVALAVTDIGTERVVEFQPLGYGLLVRTVSGILDSDSIGQDAKIGTSRKVAEEMSAAFQG